MSTKKMKKGEVSLTPPDLEQCQAEKPNGNSFMTLGGSPGRVRCTNVPVLIAIEVEPGPDGHRGAMSLCLDCHVVILKYIHDGKVPDCTFAEIAGGDRKER